MGFVFIGIFTGINYSTAIHKEKYKTAKVKIDNFVILCFFFLNPGETKKV